MRVRMKCVIFGLFAIVLTAALAGAADRWWAVAVSWSDYPVAYGAAWNYPTLEEAGAAAEKACRERSDDCKPRAFGSNSCFIIVSEDREYLRPIVRDTKPAYETVRGTFYYVVAKDLKTRAEAEASARRILRSSDKEGLPPGSTVFKTRIDLLECALPN